MTTRTKIFLGIGIAFALVLITLFVLRKKIFRILLSAEQEVFIRDLHPKQQNLFRKFIAAAQKRGWKVVLTSGFRSFAKQGELKKANSKNASPGRSVHNYGYAIDVNLVNIQTKKWLKKASPKTDWIASGIPKLAEEMGLRWGGKAFAGYYDPVHFEKAVDTKVLLAQAKKQFGSDVTKIEGNKVLIT